MKKLAIIILLSTSVVSAYAGTCSVVLKKQWPIDSRPTVDSQITVEVENVGECKEKAVKWRDIRSQEIGTHKMVNLKAEYTFVSSIEKGSVGFLPADLIIEESYNKIIIERD